MALPPEKAERIELIVAVTESGTAVPNAAKAEAELKALGEAVGPAPKDQLKTLVATE